MDYILYLLGGLMMSWIIGAFIRAPGEALNQKFESLGNLHGKSLQEIVKAVGAYTAVSASPDGGKLVQWMAAGYHIVLLFDENDICTEISHEVKP